MANSNHFAKSSWMLTLASLAVVVAALYLAKGVLIPLTLAVLLSFQLVPLCDWLERRKLRRIPAVLVTVILAFSVLGAGAWMAAVQMTDLAPKIPVYQSNIQTKLLSVNDYLSNALGKVIRTAQDAGEDFSPSETTEEPSGGEERPIPVKVIAASPSPLQVISGVFGTILGALGSAGIVIVLVVFFLVRREDLRDRFIRLVGRGQVTCTTQTLEEASARVSRYLSMQLIVNITYGAPVAIGLYMIGVPNAILWGILATALRFIPYIGPLIAAVAPIGLSMTITTGWGAPLLTLGLFLVLELISNNVIEPWIYGKNTGVSPVAVLVAAVFWTWLWGVGGLLLATPLTVCLLVVGKHVPDLSFLAILLGDEPVFEPKKRVYQRLLAGDQEEAAELIEGFLEHMPLVEVYDTVLVPALAFAEIDWHRGDLDESRHTFILQSLRTSIEDLGDRHQAIQAKNDAAETKEIEGASSLVLSADTSKLCVLCLPAHDEADEIAALMLAQLLELGGCTVHAVSVTALVSEMVELVERHNADVVCISSTPPAAMMHARYLSKRLRGRIPESNLVVGLWNAKSDLNQAKERIGCGAAAHVVGKFADALEQVRQMIQSPLLRREKLEQQEIVPMVLAGACA